MRKTGLALKEIPFQYKPLPEYELEAEMIDGKRFYKVSNEFFPSVTTVLSSLPKPGLDNWKKSVGEEAAARIMKAAADRGTKAHKMWEEYLRNDPAFSNGMMPSSISLFKQLQPWLDRNIDFVYGNEIALFSKELRTAGRCDVVASVNNRPAIIDFKTSTKEKNPDWIENYYLQASCYALMVEEMYGIIVEDAYILIAVEEGLPQSFPFRTSKYKNKVKEIFTEYSKNQLN